MTAGQIIMLIAVFVLVAAVGWGGGERKDGDNGGYEI